MPTYTVTEKRDQKMSFSGTDDQIKITWSKDYFVDVAGYTNINEIDSYSVMTASGLPVVNRDIYNVNGKIIPYVICRNKTCNPFPNRYDRWLVSTQWEASIKSNNEESDNVPITPPASFSDITPRVVPFLGETSQVLYEDLSETPVDCARTPAGNYWSEPVMQKIPTLGLKLTQYEDYISYEDLLDRKFKVNEEVYRSQPRFDWLIADIEPTEVDVLLSTGVQSGVQITYTLLHSPALYGWKEDRALLDTQYIENGKVKLFTNDQPGTLSSGHITVTGGKRMKTVNGEVVPDQTGPPDHIQYETFETINFSDFLLA
jgi:hypothetical protein